MPKAPQYQQTTGGVAPVSARLQAPSAVPNGLAAGMERLGQTLTAIDQLNAQHDDTVARQQVLALQPQLSDALAQFKTQQGGNAVDGLPAAQKQLADIRNQGMAGLKSPRAQKIFGERFDTLYASALGDVDAHAIQQAGVQRKGVLAGEKEEALNALSGLGNDPKAFGAGLEVLRQKSQAEADFAGMGEAGAQFVKQDVGRAIGTTVQTLLDSGQVAMAKAVFDAHHDEMTFDQRNAVTRLLAKPLLEREDAQDFAVRIISEVSGQPGQGAHQQGQVAGVAFQRPVAGNAVSNTFADHVKRGSAGIDYPAPIGSAIHPAADGVVIPWKANADSGNFVAVKHPDGSISTYSHMGAVSVKVGDEVNAQSVLGTVGMSGHTTGPHLHFRLRDANGKDVDPATVVGKPGVTPVIGLPSAPRNWDQGAILAKIDRQPDWSFEKKERMKAYARQHMAQDEAVLNDQYQDAADNLHQWIGNYQASHNGEDPPPDSIPSSIAGQVKPAYMAEMRGNLAKAQKAKYDAAVKKEQEGTALALKLQSYLEPDKFAQTDLRKFQGLVPFSDMSSLAEEQAKRRAAANQWSSASAAASALATFERRNPGLLPANPGVKHPDDMATYNRQRLTILDTVSQYADGIAAKGTIPTEAQLQQAVTQATKQIRFANGNVGHLYDIQFSNLTPQTVQTIRNNLRLRGVRNVTDDDVVREYRRTARDSQGN